jgi:hypothetical protein
MNFVDSFSIHHYNKFYSLATLDVRNGTFSQILATEE